MSDYSAFKAKLEKTKLYRIKSAAKLRLHLTKWGANTDLEEDGQQVVIRLGEVTTISCCHEESNAVDQTKGRENGILNGESDIFQTMVRQHGKLNEESDLCHKGYKNVLDYIRFMVYHVESTLTVEKKNINYIDKQQKLAHQDESMKIKLRGETQLSFWQS